MNVKKNIIIALYMNNILITVLSLYKDFSRSNENRIIDISTVIQPSYNRRITVVQPSHNRRLIVV